MHKIIRSLSILSLALAFGAFAANAQSTTKMGADIPFAFNVGTTTLAPGKYDIRVIASAAGTASVCISQNDGTGKWTILGLANTEHANGQAELFFDRHGDERVLRKIILGSNGITVSTNGSRKTRYAKGSKPSAETVTITAN